MGNTWVFKEKDERINQRAGHTSRGTKKLIDEQHCEAVKTAVQATIRSLTRNVFKYHAYEKQNRFNRESRSGNRW